VLRYPTPLPAKILDCAQSVAFVKNRLFAKLENGSPSAANLVSTTPEKEKKKYEESQQSNNTDNNNKDNSESQSQSNSLPPGRFCHADLPSLMRQYGGNDEGDIQGRLSKLPAWVGDWSFDPCVGTVLPVGQHVIHATFSPWNIRRYKRSFISVTITVHPGKLALEWPVTGKPLMEGGALPANLFHCKCITPPPPPMWSVIGDFNPKPVDEDNIAGAAAAAAKAAGIHNIQEK